MVQSTRLSEYTLSELCRRVDITPPIMKKYQMLLGLGPGEKIGKRTYYSQEQLHIYERVRKLRLTEFTYDEIVALYTLERKLQRHPLRIRNEAGTDQGAHWVILIFDSDPCPFPSDWVKNDQLRRLIEQHAAMKQKIARKSREVATTLQELCEAAEDKIP